MDIHQVSTKIDLLTHSHRFAGLIDTHGYRLADILNDATTSIVELEDAVVSSRGTRPDEVQSLRSARLLVRKQDVLAAFLGGNHEAPVRRSNNRIERRRRGAMILLPALMLSGIVHLPSRVTAESFLVANSLLPSYLALTNVAIHSSEFLLPDVSYEVAIIRREWIEALELSGELVSNDSVAQ